MANILACGIATVDIVNIVNEYPPKDSEVRALEQSIRRGGNAANTLVVLSQLGHQCTWIGNLALDSQRHIICDDFIRYNIDYAASPQITAASTPTSYITLSRDDATRTIVHYRNLPELDYTAFCNLHLDRFDWFHFEARNTLEVEKMMHRVRAKFAHVPLSLEVEKPRDNLEVLTPLVDFIFYSKHYVLSLGFRDAIEFLETLELNDQQYASVCWGENGAYGRHKDQFTHAQSIASEAIIDTIGAGDTFIAGMIHSQLKQQPPQQSLNYACHLATYKCTQSGLDAIDQYSETR